MTWCSLLLISSLLNISRFDISLASSAFIFWLKVVKYADRFCQVDRSRSYVSFEVFVSMISCYCLIDFAWTLFLWSLCMIWKSTNFPIYYSTGIVQSVLAIDSLIYLNLLFSLAINCFLYSSLLTSSALAFFWLNSSYSRSYSAILDVGI
jgi:hypothetical protein